MQPGIVPDESVIEKVECIPTRAASIVSSEHRLEIIDEPDWIRNQTADDLGQRCRQKPTLKRLCYQKLPPSEVCLEVVNGQNDQGQCEEHRDDGAEDQDSCMQLRAFWF